MSRYLGVKMRILEEYKRSGYFWLPSNPEKKIPGTLTINDGGKIGLEIVGLFDDKITKVDESDKLKRIIGHVEKDGLVTLNECFYTKKSHAFGVIAKSSIFSHQVLSGVAYDEEELVELNSFSFTVDGLDEWLDISGIEVEYADDYRSAAINYTQIDDLVYQLDNGFKLSIVFNCSLPGFGSRTEAKITQRAYLKLSSETETELSDFISVAHKITSFISFAVDASLCIKDVSATSNKILENEGQEGSRPKDIKVYYPSTLFSAELPKVKYHDMVFRFCDVKDSLKINLDKWFLAYETIEPSLNLYFTTKNGAHKYLDGKFLSLSQGLETYNRRTCKETLMDKKEFKDLVDLLITNCPEANKEWLEGRLKYGNEITLSQRIKKIIEPFKNYVGNSRERNKLIRNIVNTRNYLTHYNEEIEDKMVAGAELFYLCQKMEAFFQLNFLKVIGFEDKKISEVLQNCHKLTKKLG